MNIPFLDLKKQYLQLKPAMDKAIGEVIAETAFIKGKHVHDFEQQFAEACGVKHCISVANGTDAIYIALKMLGIDTGDEVITVANTWISTAETITQAGAKPIFVDIEQEYYCIDSSGIEEKITPRTKAIIAVHLYGQSVNMTEIKALCDKHNLFLLEDCAQSHFSEFENKMVGTFGIAATFSFYPGKNLGAYGDAGAIVTQDDALAKKMRMYANHGSLIKHEHEIEGINSRLDGLQGAILSVKLPHIHNWNNTRITHAQYYTALLKDVKEITCPKVRVNSKHSFHLYVIRAEKRNELQQFLKTQGIETQIHYPRPLPFTKAYNYLNHTEQDFPVAAAYQHQILSLPMYPELENKEIEFIALKIKEFYDQ